MNAKIGKYHLDNKTPTLKQKDLWWLTFLIYNIWHLLYWFVLKHNWSLRKPNYVKLSVQVHWKPRFPILNQRSRIGNSRSRMRIRYQWLGKFMCPFLDVVVHLSNTNCFVFMSVLYCYIVCMSGTCSTDKVKVNNFIKEEHSKWLKRTKSFRIIKRP